MFAYIKNKENLLDFKIFTEKRALLYKKKLLDKISDRLLNYNKIEKGKLNFKLLQFYLFLCLDVI